MDTRPGPAVNFPSGADVPAVGEERASFATVRPTPPRPPIKPTPVRPPSYPQLPKPNTQPSVGSPVRRDGPAPRPAEPVVRRDGPAPRPSPYVKKLARKGDAPRGSLGRSASTMRQPGSGGSPQPSGRRGTGGRAQGLGTTNPASGKRPPYSTVSGGPGMGPIPRPDPSPISKLVTPGATVIRDVPSNTRPVGKLRGAAKAKMGSATGQDLHVTNMMQPPRGRGAKVKNPPVRPTPTSRYDGDKRYSASRIVHPSGADVPPPGGEAEYFARSKNAMNPVADDNDGADDAGCETNSGRMSRAERAVAASHAVFDRGTLARNAEVVEVMKRAQSGDTKKTGTYHGKSNKLGHGGRAAQLRARGVPEGVIGAIARAKGAAPGQAHYHGGKRGK